MRNWNVLRIDVISSSQNINVSLVKNDIPCMRAHLVAQSCPTLRDPMDCSPPGSSVYGIFQARILEQVAISSSKGYYPPRDQTRISCFLHWHWH